MPGRDGDGSHVPSGAVRYRAETGLVAASLLVSTLLAPFTTIAWLTLRGRA